MTSSKSPMTMLSIYGADISRWPESRLQGRLNLIASPVFRAAWRQEQALDRSLANVGKDIASQIPSDGRLERCLLARMGIEEKASVERQGFGKQTFAGFAAASLCLGLFVGGMFGDVGINADIYASEDVTIWESVLEDDDGSDVG